MRAFPNLLNIQSVRWDAGHERCFVTVRWLQISTPPVPSDHRTPCLVGPIGVLPRITHMFTRVGCNPLKRTRPTYKIMNRDPNKENKLNNELLSVIDMLLQWTVYNSVVSRNSFRSFRYQQFELHACSQVLCSLVYPHMKL